MTKSKILTVFAPAKINLFLHLTGKQDNGYHTLDSLVSFADIGDLITIEAAPSFSFHVTGEFAGEFNKNDSCTFLHGDNLVIKAARSLSQATDKPLNVKITLTKNLPLASGIGGGSSDAAATIWGLQKLWKLSHKADYLDELLIKLGADVPVCLNCTPTVMRGTGEELSHAPIMPEIPILLINPIVSCSTTAIFSYHNDAFKKNIELPKQFNSITDLIKTLRSVGNDLYEPALELVPEIKNVITAINSYEGCLLSRMSGSGATCFGLFKTIEDAETASQNIAKTYPNWWIKTGWLNRPERY